MKLYEKERCVVKMVIKTDIVNELETLKKKNKSLSVTSQFNSIVDKLKKYRSDYDRDFSKFIMSNTVELTKIEGEIASYKLKKNSATADAEQEKKDAMTKLVAAIKGEKDYLESDDFKNGHMDG